MSLALAMSAWSGPSPVSGVLLCDPEWVVSGVYLCVYCMNQICLFCELSTYLDPCRGACICVQAYDCVGRADRCTSRCDPAGVCL